METTASLAQFHKLMGLILSKYPELEGKLDKQMLQLLIKDDSRLAHEFTLFINNGGMHNLSHVINCDKTPELFHPDDGYYLKGHQKHSPFAWNPDQIELIPLFSFWEGLNNQQEFQSNRMRYEFLKKYDACNANISDYLYEHPYLFPSKWDNHLLVFLGTQYGRLYGGKKNNDCWVRCIGKDYDGRLPGRELAYFKNVTSHSFKYPLGNKFKNNDVMVPVFKKI